MEEPGVSGLVPHQFKMRNESGRKNDVDRAVTTNLVGDENIATLGILGRWQHGEALYGAILWADWTQGQWLMAASGRSICCQGTSGVGTFQTCRSAMTMSVDRCRPEEADGG